MDSDCIFCRIVAGAIPADIVRQDEVTLAFRDLNGQAPTHILVIPKQHHRTIADLAEADPSTLADLYAAATEVAFDEGLAEDGYRLVVNTGRNGGQTVDHVHVHLLGGRPMAWPPG